MPRRSAAQIRPVEADARHRNRLVQQTINKVMRDGKKRLAESLVYGALETAETKSKQPALEIFEAAIKNVSPAVQVKPSVSVAPLTRFQWKSAGIARSTSP